jgi:hypothetical protein
MATETVSRCQVIGPHPHLRFTWVNIPMDIVRAFLA